MPWTLATGLQVEIIGRSKLGVVVGWDRALESDGENWPYQGRSWMSLGINYAYMTGATPEEKK